MRVAIRCIYYKAVIPSCDIVDLDYDTWIEFFNADPIKRKLMALKLLNKPALTLHNVKEIAWIPLGNQNKLQEVPQSNI